MKIYISKHQWRKNGGLMCNLIRHRKNPYWSKACANRWIKEADNIGELKSSLSLLTIYHYPKWYIEAWATGNLMEVIKERTKTKISNT